MRTCDGVMRHLQSFLLSYFHELFSSWYPTVDLSEENVLLKETDTCKNYILGRIPSEKDTFWMPSLIFQPLYVSYHETLQKSMSLPIWFVANCNSMPSSESKKGVAIIPALLLIGKNAYLNNNSQFLKHFL